MIKYFQISFLVFIIFECLFGTALAYEFADSDSLLKLAIFSPKAKVYDGPNGENIGVIKRGRVIRLVSSQGKWLQFTTWDFKSGWIRWENTITLADWASSPSFDSMQLTVLDWERGIQSVDSEIDSVLAIIVSAKDRLAAGKISLDECLDIIKNQQTELENCFRRIHTLNIPLDLQDAANFLDEKRWAINKGLDYLMDYIKNGVNEQGIAAGKFFQLAENTMYQYAREMYRIKTKYNLYSDVNNLDK